MIDKQRIIETINEKFKGQAKVVGKNGCMYQTPCGKRCAIGMFIPDDHQGLECFGDVIFLLKQYPELSQHMPSDDIYFMHKFQAVHDCDLNDNMSLDEQKQVLIDFINNYQK